MRARRTQAERTTETRGRLVAAALTVLRDNGYTGFRVEEVSRVAKISRGAQTHHFPTKDSLVLAAVEEAFASSEARSLVRVAKLRRSQDIAKELVRDGVEFFLDDFFHVTIDLLGVGLKDGEFRRTVVSIAQNHRLAVERAWLDAMTERGIPRARAESALWLCFNVVRGLAVRRFIDDDAKARRNGLARLHGLVAAELEKGESK